VPRIEAIYASRRDAACGCGKAPGGAAPTEEIPIATLAQRATSPIARPRAGATLKRPCALHPKLPAGLDTKGEPGLGGACRPWLRVERDEKHFEACMAIAEKIGPIDSPKKAFEILKEAVGSADAEVFGGMYLDTHLYLRGLAETGKGEYDAVMAPIKPTLRIAIAEGTTGLIVFHCHPTLYSQPSDADIEVTKSFQAACEALDLFFVDHIIIGGHKEFFSFADEGYLS
jgi:hypothetical protein